MFRVREDKDAKVIDFQSLKMKDVINLCEMINNLYQDGYAIATDVPPKQVPKIPRLLNMRFVKAEQKPSEKDKRIQELEFEVEYLKQFLDKIPSDVEKIAAGEQAFLVLPSTEKNTIDIDSLRTKKELLDLAKEKDINVPEDITHPMSIKKYLKKQLED